MKRQKKRAMKTACRTGVFVFLFLISFRVNGEPLRALIAGIHTLSLDNPEGMTVPLSYISSSLIVIEGDSRFFRGIQLELNSPQNFLPYRGSLAAAVYGELNTIPETGTVDLECRRFAFELLPAKIQNIYQIPLRADHGFRTTPYVTTLTEVINISSFPLLFRLMPVIKGINSEIETMVFRLNIKPIISDEGAVRINFMYPGNLQDRPLTVLIDDVVIENPGEIRLLKEGEHNIVILSEHYRNQSSRFVIERARTMDLTVELQDPTPLMFFEYPENARVYLDDEFIPDPATPRPVEPGEHEVRFEVSDYTIMRTLTVQRGKTYRVALSVDVNISETE